MKNYAFKVFVLLLVISTLFSCKKNTSNTQQKFKYVQENYNKIETTITMRDGAKLFTSIYTPKDNSKTYPILLQRTPYSTRPYGANKFKTRIAK